MKSFVAKPAKKGSPAKEKSETTMTSARNGCVSKPKRRNADGSLLSVRTRSRSMS